MWLDNWLGKFHSFQEKEELVEAEPDYQQTPFISYMRRRQFTGKSTPDKGDLVQNKRYSTGLVIRERRKK